MIEPLLIKTRQEVFGQRGGLFSSSYKGEGFDFYELREYDYQSDARKIDWRSFAKTGKPFVKVFHDDRIRRIVLIFLESGDLLFGSKRLKSEILIEAAAILGYSALRYQEELWFEEEPIFDSFTLDKKLKNITIIPGQKRKSFQKLFYTIPHKSFVIFLGDFFEPIDLNLFCARHEVLAITARSSIEKSFWSGETQAIDPKSIKESTLTITPYKTAKYRQNLDLALAKNRAKNPKASFLELWEDEDVYTALQRYFWSI